MSTPNTKNHSSNTNNNTTTPNTSSSNSTNNTNNTTPVKGQNTNNTSENSSSSTQHHDVNTNINTSPSSRGPSGSYQNPNGMIKPNNYMGQRPNYHSNNNTRQPHHNNHHHHQGPPSHQPQQFYSYQPQYPPPIYQGFQPQVHPPQYIPSHQNYHPPQGFVQGPPPGVNIQTGFHPQGPQSPVPPHLHPQGPPPSVTGPGNPQSPNQPRHQPQIPHQPPTIINQPVVQPQPQNQNRKLQNNKSSVNSNNIPPRTHSAPPSSSDIQEHGINQPNQPKFVPEKTGLNTSAHQFVPTGPVYNKSPIPQGQIPPPHPHEQPPPPYGGGYGLPYYAPHQPHGGYYDPYQAVYFNPNPNSIHPPMNPSATPYIKETKTSSKLAIINPETMEQVNQSPPKSTPQQPPFSPPTFSLGNESIRNQKQKEKKDENKKEDTGSDDKKTTATVSDQVESETKSVEEEEEEIKKEETVVDKEESTTNTVVSSTDSTPTKMETIKEDEISNKSSTEVQISQESLEKPANNNTASQDDLETSVLVEDIKKLSVEPENTLEEVKEIDDKSNIESQEQQIKEESNTNTSTSTNADTDTATPPTSTIPLSLRTTGDKITYSRDFMISLQPKSIEEPRNIKDLKTQMETSSGNLNRSGNKIQRNMMNMSGNNFNQQGIQQGIQQQQQQQQNQQGMKMYPNQMQMKNYPQNKNYQYAKYQQQIQQGMQQMNQGFQPQQPMAQFGYGLANLPPPVQPPIATQVNENRWMPTEVNKLDDIQKILRKGKFILNRISPEKFDVLIDELLGLGIIDTEEVHRGTIQIIFEKALNESKFCTMYSEVCKRIFEFEKNKKNHEKTTYLEANKEEAVKYMGMTKVEQDNFEDKMKLKPIFRKLLLITCQSEYEKVTREFEKPDQTLPDNSTHEEKTDFEEKQFIKRKLEFGLIKFIGELFNKDMLSEKILHGIFVNLLGELNKPVEIKLECFCKLLTITGKTLFKNEKATSYLSKYCDRMKELINLPSLSQRLKFLIQNVLDLKANNWVPKSDEAPKPLKEFESNKEDERKSNTGVKTNIKNNFITNSIFSSTKFNTKIPSPSMPNIPANKVGAPMQPPTIMKKPPGLSQSSSFNNNYNNKGTMSNSNNNLNNSSSTSPQSPTNNAKKYQEQWDKVKKTVEEVISEYLELQDKSEFIGCIEDYIGKQLFLYPYVISTMLTSSINLSESLFGLLMDLVNDDKIFSIDDFKEGFNLFTTALPDLYEDRPGSYKNIGDILYQCYNAKMLTLPLLSSLLSKQVEPTQNFISQILFEFILQFKNPKEAASNFSDQKINISDFFVKKDKPSIIDASTKYNSNLGVFFDNLNGF